MSAASLVASLKGTLSIWEREQRHKAWHCSSWMAQGFFVLRDFIWAGGLHRVFITFPGVLQYIHSSKCEYKGSGYCLVGCIFQNILKRDQDTCPSAPGQSARCDPLAPSVLGEVTSNLVIHQLAVLAHTVSPCLIFSLCFPYSTC